MRRLAVITAIMVLLGCCTGYAQNWPTRPVRIIVPQTPGGGADTVARVIAPYLSDALHQSFFVEDRPGVTSSKRIADFPNVPTFKELGYSELVVIAWWAFSEPAGLPNAIVRQLHDLVNQAIQTPRVRQRLEREYMEIELLSQQQTAHFVEAEVKKWGPIARAALASRKIGKE